MTAVNEQGRIFGLDLLRALAVLFVVYGHGWLLIENTYFSTLISKNIYLIPQFDGVSIFFVLSGFLIGRILLRTIARENFDFRMLVAFWIRRWFRTLPNYFLVLFFLSIYAYSKTGSVPHLVRYLTFSQNIASPHPNFFPEAWSLAVEEWFYLAAPLPLYLSVRFKTLSLSKTLVLWICVFIIFSTALRFYRFHFIGCADINEWNLNLRKQVVTRMDSLMFGVLGAYLSLHYSALWARAANSAFFIGLSLLVFDKTLRFLLGESLAYVGYFSLTVNAVGTLFLLPKLSNWRKEAGIFVKTVTFVSLTSYSMYLLNLSPVQTVVLMHYLWRLNEYSTAVTYVSYWVITIGCSWLLFKCYEKPMTDLREKWPSHGRQIVKAFADLGKKTPGIRAGKDMDRPFGDETPILFPKNR